MSSVGREKNRADIDYTGMFVERLWRRAINLGWGYGMSASIGATLLVMQVSEEESQMISL